MADLTHPGKRIFIFNRHIRISLTLSLSLSLSLLYISPTCHFVCLPPLYFLLYLFFSSLISSVFLVHSVTYAKLASKIVVLEKIHSTYEDFPSTL